MPVWGLGVTSSSHRPGLRTEGSSGTGQFGKPTFRVEVVDDLHCQHTR